MMKIWSKLDFRLTAAYQNWNRRSNGQLSNALAKFERTQKTLFSIFLQAVRQRAIRWSSAAHQLRSAARQYRNSAPTEGLSNMQKQCSLSFCRPLSMGYTLINRLSTSISDQQEASSISEPQEASECQQTV